MAITILKQYSVFLANRPGTLKTFADLFVQECINIIAISQDIRYDSAVMRLAIDNDSEEISRAIIKAGFTSVKTDAICLELDDRMGMIRDVAAVLGAENINISAIYGSTNGPNSRLILVVNDIDKAIDVLEKSKLATTQY